MNEDLLEMPLKEDMAEENMAEEDIARDDEAGRKPFRCRAR